MPVEQAVENRKKKLFTLFDKQGIPAYANSFAIMASIIPSLVSMGIHIVFIMITCLVIFLFWHNMFLKPTMENIYRTDMPTYIDELLSLDAEVKEDKKKFLKAFASKAHIYLGSNNVKDINAAIQKDLDQLIKKTTSKDGIIDVSIDTPESTTASNHNSNRFKKTIQLIKYFAAIIGNGIGCFACTIAIIGYFFGQLNIFFVANNLTTLALLLNPYIVIALSAAVGTCASIAYFCNTAPAIGGFFDELANGNFTKSFSAPTLKGSDWYIHKLCLLFAVIIGLSVACINYNCGFWFGAMATNFNLSLFTNWKALAVLNTTGLVAKPIVATTLGLISASLTLIGVTALSCSFVNNLFNKQLGKSSQNSTGIWDTSTIVKTILCSIFSLIVIGISTNSLIFFVMSALSIIPLNTMALTVIQGSIWLAGFVIYGMQAKEIFEFIYQHHTSKNDLYEEHGLAIIQYGLGEQNSTKDQGSALQSAII